MKLNKILMALSAMAIVGCSSEDFNDPSATQAINDSRLIQLDESFILAGVGAEDGITRTHWEKDAETGALVNKFLPIYATDPANDDVLNNVVNNDVQAVGLCWLGQGAVGTDVYTNYQFYHFGWLKKGEKEADVDNCTPFKLYNGVLYNEIKLSGITTEKAGDEAKENTFDWTAITTPVNKSAWELNYNSGVYKTDNKSIFGGKYIVYYPYNPDFKEHGTIPAKAETSFEWDATKDKLEASKLGEATFRYSAPVDIEGGMNAANFGLYNLSTLVRLSVISDASLANKEVDQIVLYSESEKFVKQAYLAADKIDAGKTGAELYTDETEGTKTIVTTFKNTLPKLNTTATTTGVKPYITVLPTTVDDLVALVHIKTIGWARVELATTEFKAGKGQVINITVNESDVTSDIIATDETSLTAALTEAEGLAKPVTITVIGDIRLSTALDIDEDNDKYITIEGGDIIVPENVTLTLTTLKEMKSTVRVLGKSCCSGTKGGELVVKGGTINNVTMEKTAAKNPDEDDNPTLTYSGDATVAAGKTIDVQAGKVEVNAAVAHKGDIKIAKGATVTVYGSDGDLNFMGSTVTNDGTIEVKADGNFDMTDANGNATADDGKRMTNNGTFIHNVDAGVGTAVQKMNQNGEYRCRVNDQIKLDDAFLQWTACSVIEMVDKAVPAAVSYNLGTAAGITPAAYKHNGKYIDIEVSATAKTTFNNIIETNKGDDKDIMIGNLTVKQGELEIDFVSDNGLTGDKKVWYKRTLTVNGDMTVSAKTTMTDSKKINVTGNLTVSEGKTLIYAGNKANEDGLAVTKDIKVSGIFNASALNALNITCANFTLSKPGSATFGNRTEGAAKNMVVSGTIDNPKDCTFDISAAADGNVLAWVSCKELKVGGTFPHSKPRVE